LKKKNIKNPIEIILSACFFMQYWTGLQSLDTQKAIDEGVNLMLKTAFKLLGKQAKTVHGPLLPRGSDGADGGESTKPQVDSEMWMMMTVLWLRCSSVLGAGMSICCFLSIVGSKIKCCFLS
jgi:hypothetical protein